MKEKQDRFDRLMACLALAFVTVLILFLLGRIELYNAILAIPVLTGLLFILVF